MNETQITPLACTNYRNKCQIFGIKPDDRRRHMYVIGKTGMGKTTLLENMVISDIRSGNGVAVVDPHGEFAEKMLDHVPKERINDVLYFDPGDQDFPITFNVFEQVPETRQHLVASGLLGVFKKLWADSWGPRLEYILRNAIISLLYYPEATLLDVMRILVDKQYRKFVLPYIKDPVLTSFWVEEFSQYNQQFQSEAIAPIQNKVGQFLTAPLIRNIVGQKKSAFDIRELMDQKKILILNLSKGRIGEDNAALLGAMIITKIQLAAMSRIDLAEQERSDFYLYVDEFQNFATDSFANILSEARKYRLNLILAHQYIEQLDQNRPNKIVRDAVFGNVGTTVCFRVGADDAEFLEREFMPTFLAQDLVNLAKFNIYIKLMIDGVSCQPFSAETIATPVADHPSYRDEIINNTRSKYATPKAVVLAEISKLYGFYGGGSESKLQGVSSMAPNMSQGQDSNKAKSPAIPPTVPREREIKDAGNPSDVAKYFATCSKCQDTVKVPFAPDGQRPVFCKDCFKKAQQLKENGVIPSVSAYVDFEGAKETDVQAGGAKGFAALKDIMAGRSTPQTPKKPVVRHITETKPIHPTTEVSAIASGDHKKALRELLAKAVRPESNLKSPAKQDTMAMVKTNSTDKKIVSKKAVPESSISRKSKVLKRGEVVRPGQ